MNQKKMKICRLCLPFFRLFKSRVQSCSFHTHTHIVIEMKMKERKSVTFIHSSALVCYRCRSKVGIYLVSRTYFHKYVCSVSTGAGRPSITNIDKSQWLHHHTHTMYWTIGSIFMWPTGSLWSVVDSCAKFNLI